MDSFRAIYHGNPADPHAAPAIAQVAELLAEQGRELHDAKSLRDAAGQYSFLAAQYPMSPLAGPALASEVHLFTELNDTAETRRANAELKKKFPGRYKTLLAQADAAVQTRIANEATGLTPALRSGRDEKEAAASPGSQERGLRTRSGRGNDGEALAPKTQAQAVTEAPKSSARTAEQDLPPVRGERADAHAPLAKVTGIRHWSTPSYTRVAIDLGDEVTYEAARVEHPDRIFFDLHHARLAPELVGKSFAITDDGFLTRIRAAQNADDVTRVVLDVHEVTDYSAFLLPNPYRLIIDIHGKQRSAAAPAITHFASANDSAPRTGGDGASGLPPMPVTDGSAGFGLPPKSGETTPAAVAPPRVVIPVKPTAARPVPNSVVAHTGNNGTEVADVSSQPGKVEATHKPTSAPVMERAERPYVSTRTPKAAPAVAPPPTADGETSLMRALGLKIGRIVIDAGHGGHDSGTLGAEGIQEKDVVLDVALRLGKLLHQKLGAEIIYTRADDTFIPLETRTAIANKAQADLFISVHANSSPDPSARGTEVYYLNFTSDPEAMRVASRENAVSSQSVHELSDLVKKIALKDKIDESRELAADVEDSLFKGLQKGNDGLRNRGVKKAPFVVLIGANMPSILAEISFVTNPDDAAQLQTPEYRQRVAESLFNGVARYASGINGIKVPAAQKVAAKK